MRTNHGAEPKNASLVCARADRRCLMQGLGFSGSETIEIAISKYWYLHGSHPCAILVSVNWKTTKGQTMKFTVKYRTGTAPMSEGEVFNHIDDLIDYISEDTEFRNSSPNMRDVKEWSRKPVSAGGIMVAGFYGDESEDIRYYIEKDW